MAACSFLSNFFFVTFCLLHVCSVHGGRLTQFYYIGCFNDNGDNVRDLDGLKDIVRFGSYNVMRNEHGIRIGAMKHKLCSSICSLGGFLYFGVQSAAECFCGNSYGSQGLASAESECDKACVGNNSQKCGGHGRNSLFALNYLNANKFKPADKTYMSVSTSYSQQTFWTIGVTCLAECLYQCRVGCQAVIFSQQQSLCHLLRFATVPSELVSSAGEFFARG